MNTLLGKARKFEKEKIHSTYGKIIYTKDDIELSLAWLRGELQELTVRKFMSGTSTTPATQRIAQCLKQATKNGKIEIKIIN